MRLPKRLLNKNFVLLWQGQLVSAIGTQAWMIATMYWVKHATGSATLMGTVLMVGMIPMVALGPFGGTLADRFSRKKIIVGCDLTAGVAVLSLAALMFLVPERTGLILGWLFVVAAINGAVGAFFSPAILASIPSLVPEEKVAAANSLEEGSVQVSTLLGQGIGGVLFRVLGAPVLFLIDGVSYLVSAFSESFITIPQQLSDETETIAESVRKFKSEMREGVSYVWNTPMLRSALSFSAVYNFFGSPFIVLLPFLVEDRLALPSDWYGYILAGFGGGALVGYVVAGSIHLSGRVRGMMLIGNLMALSLGVGAFGIAGSGPVAVIIAAVTGISQGILHINVVSILQLSTPENLRGRLFGILHTVVMGLTPVSLALAGVVTDAVDHNVAVVFVACGLILFLTTLVASLNRAYREFLTFEAETSVDVT